MKKHHIAKSALIGLAMMLSSCMAPYYDEGGAPDGKGQSVPVSPGTTVTPTAPVLQQPVNPNIAWTTASYDVAGFPIYGYSYGRPVYGYTTAGAAVYSIAALTPLCIAPSWAPAAWYHGHWHHPHSIRRCAVPPRFAAGHRPGMRPHGGMHIGGHRHHMGGRHHFGGGRRHR